MVQQKVCLICIDGWGIAQESRGNAIANASTPTMDQLSQKYPRVELAAHGFDVGLPDGLMGNSKLN
jgi:2,3-bisphosphoglycerate-independent phosphoglycerate mutase